MAAIRRKTGCEGVAPWRKDALRASPRPAGASEQLGHCRRAGSLLQRNGRETFEGPAGWIHGDTDGLEGSDAEEALGVIGPENDAAGRHLAHELDPDETELVLVQRPIGKLVGRASDRLDADTTELVSRGQRIRGPGVDEEVRLVRGGQPPSPVAT